ncbi:hypothetical protein [Dyadobacter chenhuakuii]|uniref:Outer membrane protein with beta-barrel domain n=1 Tax=Dyadobacter chenhuakuii TaxID=2909339 RepID=A0ABY4XSB0_9BACT|nr:hypothetical protein [Dyadobacter chenhuakuii]MCF2492437.1 hypothetical protein [Dyadobacter chenhuakuii]USJ33262.1 hypothetical protein NFI80_11025 [Dyadobacter chenhuakuii]
MKTEQFDDEFRKKLLGLDPSDEEVDRIYNYVSSNGNMTPRFSWIKILIYGLAASLLVGSLSFNYVQNLTNKKLLSSLDSLKSRITSIELNSAQKTSLRVDTIYIDRYIEKTIAAQNHQELLYTRQGPHNEIQQPINNPLTDESVQNLNFQPADSSGMVIDKTDGTVGKSIARNNASGTGLNTYRSDDAVVEKESSEIKGNDNNPANKAPYTNNENFLKAGKTILNSRIGNIHLSFTHLKLPVLKTPEKLPLFSKDKPKYYSESMKSVLKKMDYYVGGSLDAGNRQVAGALLGELRLTPKWSFQTGARWAEITGHSYDTAEQFGQKTGQDFRALYAPYVAQNVDLLNIEQNHQLVQIPLTIAYHYELSPNWALRFGIGTDLSIYALKDIHFNYKKDSQSFDKGEYNAKLSIKPINDITINLGLERRSNKFLFRVSPYVSPQLRKTEFSNKGLLWGGRVQALYKLNR